MKDLIKKLVESVGPSGFEGQTRDIVRTAVLPNKSEVDAMGNLIVRIGKKTNDGMRIMLAAHIDEIGIMVTHIDENGFIRFTNIGGVYPRNCPGGRVRFTNGVEGVIGIEKLDDPGKAFSLDQLYVDVGALDKEHCPVKIGDVAGFERPFMDLGKRLIAKSMDDRIGAAILIEVIKQIKTTPHELVFVFSTQEEVGIRGAQTAAYAVDPEMGISVDVTATGDTPKGLKMAVAVGKGPAIKVRDGGMLSDPRLVKVMVDCAEKAGLPYQLEVLEGGTTDARAMQVSRAGMSAGCVSIPCRYVHSPSEMVDIDDVQNAVRLFVELLSRPIHLG